MPQLQTQVPHPLADDTPCLLTASGVTTPTIRVDLLIFVSQRRFKGATMEIQFDDIRSGESLLRQRGEEKFIDDTRTRDANRTLLVTGWMSRHHHAAPHPLWPHRHRLPSRRDCVAPGFPGAAGSDRGEDADAPGRAGDQ